MTVLVAMGEGKEGEAALTAAIAEAELLGTALIVMNLTLDPSDRIRSLVADEDVTIVDRSGPGDRDPVDAVLDEIDDREDVQRLVIGLRRRSRLSKALLGSVSQRLLLGSPIPVLAVKVEQ